MEENFTFTPDQLKNNHSGTYNRELAKSGYRSARIIEFWGTEYVVVFEPSVKPGRNRMEVINTSHHKDFQIARSGQGNAFIAVDEGISILTIYEGKFYEYTNPITASLTFNVCPPSLDDVMETRDEMADEEFGQ